jgi:hypothetical protein
LGHLYDRPNFRHLLSRHITISPQFGQGNFVASVPGAIILWHDVHVGMAVVVAVVLSLMLVICLILGFPY